MRLRIDKHDLAIEIVIGSAAGYFASPYMAWWWAALVGVGVSVVAVVINPHHKISSRE